MALYRVERCRIGYACDTIEVEAKNSMDAELKADDKDFDKSEHDATYEYQVTLISGDEEPLTPAQQMFQAANKPIYEPLTVEQVKAIRDEQGCISAIVPMDIENIIHGDYEAFLDILEEKILAHGVLSDITYQVHGTEKDGSILISVQGIPVGDDYE